MPEPYTVEQAEDDISYLRNQVDLLTEILAQNDFTAGNAPNTPSQGYRQYSAARHQKYMSSEGNPYSTGRLTLWTTATQLINSTVAVTIGANSTPLSATLFAGTYRFRTRVWWLMGATTANINITFVSPARTMVFLWTRQTRSITPLGTPGGWVEAESADTSITATYAVPTTTGDYSVMELEGIITLSASGTFAVQAAEGTNLDTCTMQIGSFLEIFPCT